MKKITKAITILLAAIMMLSVIPNSVFAYEESDEAIDCTESYIMGYDSKKDYTFYDTSNNRRDKRKDIYYSEKTNTLTLKNLKSKDFNLSVQNMGKNFKIKLIGTSTIQCLSVYGNQNHDAFVKFTGKGSLSINNNRKATDALSLFGRGKKNGISVASTATLKLSAGKTKGVSNHSLRIIETTLSPSKAVVSSKKIKLKKKGYKLSARYKNVWLPLNSRDFDADDLGYNRTFYLATDRMTSQTVAVIKSYDCYTVFKDCYQDKDLGLIANTETIEGMSYTQKELDKNYKVDYSKKYKGYLAHNGSTYNIYTKKGSKDLFAVYVFRFNLVVYKLTYNEKYDRYEGYKVEKFTGKACFDSLKKAGYSQKLSKTKVYDITSSSDIIIKGKTK